MWGIIIGLIGIGLGFLMVWKPQWFLDLIGEQGWSEKIFGYGHGTTAYQVIGVILIFISFMLMTGLLGDLVLWFFGPLSRF